MTNHHRLSDVMLSSIPLLSSGMKYHDLLVVNFIVPLSKVSMLTRETFCCASACQVNETEGANIFATTGFSDLLPGI